MNIRNPRTGVYDYTLATTPKDSVKDIARSLRANQVAWQAMGFEKRLEILAAWNVEMQKDKDVILEALVADTGRLVESEREMLRLPSSIDKLAVLGKEVFKARSHRLNSMPHVEIQGGLSPYPLVGVISPWNFPLSSSLLDTIPALVAGCAAIVKPSEFTPRFVQPFLATLERVPEMHAVLRYVVGPGDLGAELVSQVDAVCFTGSVATGKKVAESAARHFIPAFLELGGKDPAIVTADAQLDQASTAIAQGALSNAGQVCVSIERVYVDAKIADTFVEKLLEKTQSFKLAYPTIHDGNIGPIIQESQASVINRHLDDALAKGAKIITGGHVKQLDGGYWGEPTIVTGVDHSMLLMTEETFGPIIPVMAYSDIEQAIEWANDSEYGLSAAVFSGDVDQALKIAERMDVGAVSINGTGYGTAAIGEGNDLEKNAFKNSGLAGSRLGYDSILRFMRKKSYLINRSN